MYSLTYKTLTILTIIVKSPEPKRKVLPYNITQTKGLLLFH